MDELLGAALTAGGRAQAVQALIVNENDKVFSMTSRAAATKQMSYRELQLTAACHAQALQALAVS